MDSLMPAPRHSTCNGICEGCRAYPKCPEPDHFYCDTNTCEHASWNSDGWFGCAKEDEWNSLGPVGFEDDPCLPVCPFYEVEK
jgi:hypothetical protein